MRRQHFEWTYVVLSLVLTIYGAFSLIYSHINNKDVPILGLIFLIVGGVLLLIYIVLVIITLIQKKKRKVIEEPTVVEEKVEEPLIKEDPVVKEDPLPKVESTTKTETTYVRSKPTRSFNGGSGYIKLVGYGPVLRIEEEEILDMRNNTYYRIEGNMVKRLGSGPVFEISGNRIRSAFGGYLYEISGSNVNKIYGGFYASFSGGYLQTHDLKEKFEITCSLNLKQQLAVVALIFGEY